MLTFSHNAQRQTDGQTTVWCQ